MPICPICTHEAVKRYSVCDYEVFRCRSCCHLFLDPIPSHDEVVVGYASENTAFVQNHVSTYEHLERSETMSPRVRRKFEEYLAHREDVCCCKFLDIGAGSGKLMRMAQAFGWTAEGLEPGPWGAEAAEKHKLTIFPLMIEDVPTVSSVRTSSYDMVAMIDVIEHLRDPVLALHIVCGLLKSGGVLVLQFPYSSSFPHWTRGRRWPLINLPGHIHYFSTRSVDMILGGSGLALLDDFTEVHSSVLPKAHGSVLGRIDDVLTMAACSLKRGDLRTVFCKKL